MKAHRHMHTQTHTHTPHTHTQIKTNTHIFHINLKGEQAAHIKPSLRAWSESEQMLTVDTACDIGQGKGEVKHKPSRSHSFLAPPNLSEFPPYTCSLLLEQQ